MKEIVQTIVAISGTITTIILGFYLVYLVSGKDLSTMEEKLMFLGFLTFAGILIVVGWTFWGWVLWDKEDTAELEGTDVEQIS